MIIYLGSPSGAGKDTLIAELEEWPQPRFVGCKRVTTRTASRSDDNIRYDFLPEHEFYRRNTEGEFILVNRFAGHWYGVPIEYINQAIRSGSIPVLKGTAESLPEALRRLEVRFPDELIATFYLFPASVEDWRRRLRDRGTESAAQIEARIADSIIDINHARRYLGRYIHRPLLSRNGDVASTVSELVEVVAQFRAFQDAFSNIG